MVIINNFNIPKSCRDCAFARGEYLDTSWEKGYCGLGEGAFNEHSDTQRLKSCPIDGSCSMCDEVSKTVKEM